MVARRGERLAERKNEGEKKKEAAAGEKGTHRYTTAKGVRGLVFGAYVPRRYVHDRYIDVRTHVRVHTHGRGCGGSRVCTRIRARVVREEFLPAHGGISSYVAQHWPPSLEQAGWN